MKVDLFSAKAKAVFLMTGMLNIMWTVEVLMSKYASMRHEFVFYLCVILQMDNIRKILRGHKSKYLYRLKQLYGFFFLFIRVNVWSVYTVISVRIELDLCVWDFKRPFEW